MAPPATPDRLDELTGLIDRWLDAQVGTNPVVAAVDRDTTDGQRRWFVRVRGEEKDVFSIWFLLRQRSLHYETYVLAAPEEDGERFYRYLLRHNRDLFGAAFVIGEEDAVFLAGSLDLRWVDEDELDRILGSLYQWVERYFRSALRIGFASRFANGQP